MRDVKSPLHCNLGMMWTLTWPKLAPNALFFFLSFVTCVSGSFFHWFLCTRNALRFFLGGRLVRCSRKETTFLFTFFKENFPRNCCGSSLGRYSVINLFVTFNFGASKYPNHRDPNQQAKPLADPRCKQKSKSKAPSHETTPFFGTCSCPWFRWLHPSGGVNRVQVVHRRWGLPPQKKFHTGEGPLGLGGSYRIILGYM